MTYHIKSGAQKEERLITEYPLREAVYAYLRSWGEMVTSSFKVLIVTGAALALVHLVVAFSLTTLITTVALSSLTFLLDLVVRHPVVVTLLAAALVLLIVLTRGGKTGSPLAG